VSGRRRDDTGTVTAEMAIGLVAVVAVLVTVLAVASASLTRVRCADAARTAARVATLGEDDTTVRAAARQVAGPSASVTITRADGWVTVQVSAPVVAEGPFGGLRATATAVGRAEPGAPNDPPAGATTAARGRCWWWGSSLSRWCWRRP
jgi:Flp pilus assembly protein TadG